MSTIAWAGICAAAALSAAWADGAECGPDLVQVVSPGGRPACVSEESADTLQERGWRASPHGAWTWGAGSLRLSENFDGFVTWTQTGDGGWRVPDMLEIEVTSETRGRRPSDEAEPEASTT